MWGGRRGRQPLARDDLSVDLPTFYWAFIGLPISFFLVFKLFLKTKSSSLSQTSPSQLLPNTRPYEETTFLSTSPFWALHLSYLFSKANFIGIGPKLYNDNATVGATLDSITKLIHSDSNYCWWYISVITIKDKYYVSKIKPIYIFRQIIKLLLMAQSKEVHWVRQLFYLWYLT
jgi:hypothetical protein